VKLTATSPSGVSPVTITVTFNAGVNGGGGNGTLTSSISPINLSSSQTFSNPTITTTSITPITISVSTSTSSCTGVNWLSANVAGTSTISQSSGGTSLAVSANLSGLASGTCQGTITVTPSTGAALSIPVNLTVGSGSGGNLSANPNPASLSYSTGGTLPATNVFISSNTGITSYTATVNCPQGWLLANNATSSSSLVSSGMTVSASSNATVLGTGTYTCSIGLADFTNPTVTLTNLTVNLFVNGGSTNGLVISPNPINFSVPFNGGQQSTTVTVTSQQSGTLNINNNACNWLTFNGSGFPITAGVSTSISVFANPAGYSVGTYNCSLTFTVGTLSVSVPVSMTVGSGTGGSTAAAPSTVNLIYQSGASPSFASHPIVALTGPDGQWSTSISYGGSASGWLFLSPATGQLPQNNTITLAANITG
jgi:hypothetical protein